MSTQDNHPITKAIKPPSDIKTYPDNILEMRVFDCMAQKWAELAVPYRRTLLGLMHANVNYAVGEVLPNASPRDLRPFRVAIGRNREEVELSLDIAGSSRTHGRFVFSDGEIGLIYFFSPAKPEDTNSGRINYGSLLLSTGRRLFGRQCSIKIVTDGKDGDYSQDNPYFVGDSHGKASKALLEEIAFLLNERNDQGETISYRDIYNPCQIRVGFYKEYVAKATISYLPKLDEEGIDLVLPLSCFKIKKPPTGDRLSRIAIGVLNDAQTRIANTNYQLWQWFSWDVVRAELLPLQTAEATKLAQARDNIRNLAAVLGQPLGQLASPIEWNPRVSADSPEDEEDAADEEDRYISKLARIVRGDVSGKLLDHPWIVEGLKRQFRKRWLDLAVNGPIKFYSFMAQPCELLPDDTFACKHLPLGEYLVFRNPIRHWGDIRVWRNVRIIEVENQLQLSRYNGVVWMNHKTAAKAGGDFDGDWFQFMNVEQLPGISTEARVFSTTKYGEPPHVVKPPKIPVPGTLAEVAIRSMEEVVGTISNSISRASALLSHLPETDYYQPVKDELKEAIAFLSQQLQLSIDRLKFDIELDQERIDYWKAFIEEVSKEEGGQIPWVTARNNDASIYLTKAMPVDANSNDTISLMIQNVNDIWQPWVEFPRRQRLTAFRTLFPYKYGRGVEPQEWTFTNIQVEEAEIVRERYGSLIKTSIQLEEEGKVNEAKSYRIKAAALIRDERRRIEESVASGEATLETWLLCYWHVAHATTGKGTGSIVFNLFADEIAEKLRQIEPTKEFMVIGLGQGEYQGQIIKPRRGTVEIYPLNVSGRAKKGIRVDWDDEVFGNYRTVGHLLDENEGDFDMGARFVANLQSLTTTIGVTLTDGKQILIGSLAQEWTLKLLEGEELELLANSTGQWWNFQARIEKIQVRGRLVSSPEAGGEALRLIGVLARRSPTLTPGEFYRGTARSISTLVKGETIPGEEPF